MAGSFGRMVGLLRPHRPRIALVAAVATGTTVLSVLGPLLLGRATDLVVAGAVSRDLPAGSSADAEIARLRAAGEDTLADVLSTMDLTPGQGVDLGAVGRILLLALALYLGAAALGLVQGWLAVGIVQRAVRDLRAAVGAKLSRLPVSYFDRHPTGDVLSRMTNDVDNVRHALQQIVGQMITALIAVIGVLVLMLVVSPLLTVIVVVTTFVSIGIAGITVARAQRHFAAQWAATGELSSHSEQVYTGHALVTLFDRQADARATFDRHNTDLYAAANRAQFLSGTIEPSMVFLSNLNYIVVAVVGALRVASGSLSIGDVQAFMQFAWQFSHPIVQVAGAAGPLQSGLASAARVFALLDEPEEEPEGSPPPECAETSGRVELEGVGFGYAPDRPVLHDLSLSVRPAQTIAVVGPSGSGKTTIANLLLRFYEPDHGRILLDGDDIGTMHRAAVRSRIGLVLQETWLFRGTVAENIAYGRPGASRAEVEAAARATQVDSFVRTLPRGYDTVVDDETGDLSGGERQLITVARAYLAQRPILILDEATSSVDTRTESRIQHAMASLRQGRTSFVIAHRLSTIRSADVIVVLDSGRIVEAGRHEDLLRRDGAYARLHRHAEQ